MNLGNGGQWPSACPPTSDTGTVLGGDIFGQYAVKWVRKSYPKVQIPINSKAMDHIKLVG